MLERSEFKCFSNLFYFHEDVFPKSMSVHHVHEYCPGIPDEALDPMALALQTVVSAMLVLGN